MPLLPGRLTWVKQLACHDEMQLKKTLIKRDKHLTQGRQIQNYNHENLLRVYPQNSGYDKVSTMVYLEKTNQKHSPILIKRLPN
ncbi:hypothetical protein [Photobacterium kagoshimensis]|uniref:hypothetical protein n=1 Tax=Photobacterium kagoshimensis TaxID=2910242 RepID=UPI003D13BE61